MADAADSKSADGDIVGVQVPSSASVVSPQNLNLKVLGFFYWPEVNSIPNLISIITYNIYYDNHFDRNLFDNFQNTDGCIL